MITYLAALFARNPVGVVAGILSALLALALLGSRLQLANSRLSVEREARSIIQLQGMIRNQNDMLAKFRAEMAAKLKVSQVALKAARTAGAKTDKTIADLRSRVLPVAPGEAACKAADALILEFNP